jgi:DNA-binding LacI/PurR family transcriptional regulator
MKLKTRRTTSFDIAALAGVSQATVSRALRDGTLVSPETRHKVNEAARQLNYKVDVNARNLRLQQTRTLAVLLNEDPGTSEAQINPFFLSMLGSITRAAAQRGYDLLVSFQQFSSDWVADYGNTKRADGIIFLGYGDYVDYVSKIKALDEAGANFITWGPVLSGQPGHFIGSDNAQGAHAATAHLIHLGRQRIAFLGDASEHSPEFSARYQGYCTALGNAGLPIAKTLQRDAHSSEAEGRAAVFSLLDAGARFDAIVAASDLIALGAIKGLRERGIRVPDAVAVVGFDDIEAAGFIDPPLTTVKQDTMRAGALIVDRLIAQIGGADVGSTLIPTSLIVRESCGARLPVPVKLHLA